MGKGKKGEKCNLMTLLHSANNSLVMWNAAKYFPYKNISACKYCQFIVGRSEVEAAGWGQALILLISGKL